MTRGPAGCSETKRRNGTLRSDGRFRHSNYGKGVLFWQTNAEAACFVNAQDLVSTDAYWFTDNNLCGRSEGGGEPGVVKANNCHVAANYGWQINRVRSLVSPARSKPVWAFVEVGHPMSEDHWPSITPPQIRAAVWHSLIAGARGIIYFNHSFGGPCQTQHACGSRATRARVRRSRRRTGRSRRSPLSSTLPSSRLGGGSSRATKAMVKWQGGHFYVFAGSAGECAVHGLVLHPVRGQCDRQSPRREPQDPGPARIVRRLLRRRQRRPHLPHRRRLGLRSEATFLIHAAPTHGSGDRATSHT